MVANRVLKRVSHIFDTFEHGDFGSIYRCILTFSYFFLSFYGDLALSFFVLDFFLRQIRYPNTPLISSDIPDVCG